MSFEVVPADLITAGRQVDDLAEAMVPLVTYVQEHLTLGGGSTMFDLFRDEIESLRVSLSSDYNLRALQTVRGAADALRETGEQYLGVETTVAALVDSFLPDDHAGTYDALQPWGETAGVSQAEFDAILVPPVSEFGPWEEFQAMRDGIDYILGFDWILAAFGQMVPPDIGAIITSTIQGDYDAIGEAMGALRGIGDFWELFRAELAATVVALDATWSGNAADAAFAWFAEYDDVLRSHASNVSNVYSRIWGFAIGLRMTIDSLVGLCDTLIGIFLSDLGVPTSPLDLLTRSGRTALSAVFRKIAIVIDAMLLLCDLGLLVGGLLAMAFSQLTGHGDIRVPRVAAPEVLDVDGVA